MHGSTMIYLFVTPMAIALALYLVPLQIGARALAARGSHSPGSGVTLGWPDDADPAGSPTPAPDRPAGPPHAAVERTNSPGVGQDLWVVGVILAATDDC